MPNRPEPEFDYDAAVLACAAGRSRALEALYKQEGARLLGVARRIVGDTAQAEDIVHDASSRYGSRRAGSTRPAAPQGAGSTASLATWRSISCATTAG